MSELPNCKLCGCDPAHYPLPSGEQKHHCATRECTLHCVLMTSEQWNALMGVGEPVAWLLGNPTDDVQGITTRKVVAEHWKSQGDVIPLYATQPPVYQKSVPQTNVVRVALPVISKEIWTMLNETDLMTWDRDNERPDWTQTAVDFVSVLEIMENPAPAVDDAALYQSIAEALGEAMDCSRPWSAWDYDTLCRDDFHLLVEDSDRVNDIVDAVKAAMKGEG